MTFYLLLFSNEYSIHNILKNKYTNSALLNQKMFINSIITKTNIHLISISK
jgi:hypothetical protein